MYIKKPYKGVYHNAKTKYYPDSSFKLTCASQPVFKEPGWECDETYVKLPKPKDMTNTPRNDSARRAKEKIFDIVKLNHFEWYVTLTLNSSVVNRYDVVEIRKVIHSFFSNAVQRKNASYVVVPELHKDGAIHLHGFLSGAFSFVLSDTVKHKACKKPIKISTAKRYKYDLSECKPVYNIKDWRYGFSTAIKLDDDSSKTRIAKYTTKYITKDLSKIFGSFYFAGGKDLTRVAPFFVFDLNYDNCDYQSKSFCAETGVEYKFFDSDKFVPEVSDDDFFNVF